MSVDRKLGDSVLVAMVARVGQEEEHPMCMLCISESQCSHQPQGPVLGPRQWGQGFALMVLMSLGARAKEMETNKHNSCSTSPISR